MRVCDEPRAKDAPNNSREARMSVLVVAKVKGDVAKFRAALTERADEYEAIAKRAQAAGAIHHRFGVGDGFVVVVDEWHAVEQFEKFFGDPDLQAFIAENGGDTSTPPDITITEAVESPDQF
jgi:quinol monooxygenase YgiN